MSTSLFATVWQHVDASSINLKTVFFDYKTLTFNNFSNKYTFFYLLYFWVGSFIIFYFGFFHAASRVDGAFLIKSLIYSLIVFIILISFVPKRYLSYIKLSVFVFSFFFLLSWVYIFFEFANANVILVDQRGPSFDISKGQFAYIFQGSFELFFFKQLNSFFTFGIDGINIGFLILTAFLTFICIIISWHSVVYKPKEFFLLILCIELFVLLAFLATDLFFFFVSFEGVLIPLFLLIGIWGSRQRKLHAAFLIFFYTVCGSIFLLYGILLLQEAVKSTNYLILMNYNFDKNFEIYVWLFFFFAFAIKVPMFPFHIWLPEAHAEAPTAGSVILAGLLLKLGTYGFVRFLIPFFPFASVYYTPLVQTLCVMGIIYTSLSTMRQLDLKKIIAYSSVGHMNYAILGIFTPGLLGITGSLYTMLSHGLISSGLFIAVGLLYDRYKTRNLFDYRGLVSYMPVFSFVFFLFILGNSGFPGFSSFIGEFYILIGLVQQNFFIALVSCFSIIFSLYYSMWLFNRIIFGSSSAVLGRYQVINSYSDLSLREFLVFILMLFFIFWGGFYPNFITEIFSDSLSSNYFIAERFYKINVETVFFIDWSNPRERLLYYIFKHHYYYFVV